MNVDVRNPKLQASVNTATLTDEQLSESGISKLVDEEDPDEVISITRFVFPGFDHLPDFDIRNGNVSDVRPLLVRPTIPRSYHWVPVSGVAPEHALQVLDLYIISALYQLQNYPPAQTTEAGRRKMAIVLGTSRAVMTKHYGLSHADFIGHELAEAVISATTVKVNGKITYRTLNPTAHRDLALTNEEMVVVETLLLSSMGVLPVQGYSIIMTGHHYVTKRNSPSRRAFAIIEKQFWNGSAVKNWFAADIAMIQDCAWHKAGHPVKLSIKESTAYDEKIATMLREAGVGSAASRLPALEPQLRTAKSYLALMNEVDPLLKAFGGSADATELSEMIRIITSWPRTAGSPVDLPVRWPQSLESRDKALNWLGEVLAKNEAKVAYCYGFYCAMAEQKLTVSSETRLTCSYSLAKLKRRSYPEYIQGVLAYDDYNAAKNKKKQQLEAGKSST